MTIINIHIPKNGGTTFNDIIKRNFANAYVPYYKYHEENRKGIGKPLSEVEFLKFVEQCPPFIKIISGHHIHPASASNNEKYRLDYLTFIRHPIDRILSLYHYERKWSTRKPEIYGYHHCSQKPFEEYIDIRAEKDTALSNWQVYDLTGEFSGEIAIELLKNFLFVGLVEEFDKSLLLLQEILLEKQVLSSFDTGYVHLNTAGKQKVNKSSLSSSVLEKLLVMNQEDLKLFNYAQNRLNIELAQIENLPIKEFQHSMRCLTYSKQKSLVSFARKIKSLPNRVKRRSN